MKRKGILIVIFSLFWINALWAQTVEVDISACQTMLGFLQEMKSGTSYEMLNQRLDEILKTKPYVMMFKHYNRSWRLNHLPEDVFKRMVLSLRFKDKYKKGENHRADRMLAIWKEYYGNLERFKQNVRDVKKTDVNKLVTDAIQLAQQWLPPEMKVPDFYLFIHPNGGSSGFALQGAQGYDFYQMARDSSGKLLLDAFAKIIAHESHHLGLKISKRKLTKERDKVAFFCLAMFVGEGTGTCQRFWDTRRTHLV